MLSCCQIVGSKNVYDRKMISEIETRTAFLQQILRSEPMPSPAETNSSMTWSSKPSGEQFRQRHRTLVMKKKSKRFPSSDLEAIPSQKISDILLGYMILEKMSQNWTKTEPHEEFSRIHFPFLNPTLVTNRNAVLIFIWSSFDKELSHQLGNLVIQNFLHRKVCPLSSKSPVSHWFFVLGQITQREFSLWSQNMR